MVRIPGVGLAKGLSITLRHMLRRSVTQQYPEVKPALPARSRGVIALVEENCTSCMLCARECPDWCIYIDSHKETLPAPEGGRPRQRNVLDRFAIDFALCMYCGICIEVCPFDALFWSPEFEYAEGDIRNLLHEKEQLGGWVQTVPPPPAHDSGAEPPKELTAAPRRPSGTAGAAVRPTPSETPAPRRTPRTRETPSTPQPPTTPPTEHPPPTEPPTAEPPTAGEKPAGDTAAGVTPTAEQPTDTQPATRVKAAEDTGTVEEGKTAEAGAGEDAGAAGETSSQVTPPDEASAGGAPAGGQATDRSPAGGVPATSGGGPEAGEGGRLSTGEPSADELSTGSGESSRPSDPGEQTSPASSRRRRMADPRSIRPPGRLQPDETQESEEDS
ncbi:4Fe-4S binding protein [Nonomuraea sp. NPDC050790]|uniref:NuoI/complex I 23 kDa subunit family protein n=1 Tax=Nonomuraea sp. NPDC050790 TaxID=3364371 RepID=UPI0037A93F35